MNIIMITNDSGEARYLTRYFHKYLDILCCIVEKKYKSKKSELLRKIIGDSVYFRFKYRARTFREYKVNSLERKMKRERSQLLKEMQRGLPLPPRRNVRNINDSETAALLSSIQPDINIVVGCSILSKKTYSYAGICTLNCHMSLLPHYRGVLSEFWQSANMDFRYLGVTIHKLEQKVDEGPILFQKRTECSGKEHYIKLRTLNLMTAVELVKENCESIKNGKLEFSEQGATLIPTYRSVQLTSQLKEKYWKDRGYL